MHKFEFVAAWLGMAFALAMGAYLLIAFIAGDWAVFNFAMPKQRVLAVGCLAWVVLISYFIVQGDEA